jgi:hypothetical protein
VLVAAAVCPHPPLLMMGSGRGPDPVLADVRSACDRAVATLVAAAPDEIVVVGSSLEALAYDGSAGGSLAEYGLDVRAGGSTVCLPLSLTVGAWLLDRQGVESTATWRRRYVGVPASSPSTACADLGRALAAGPDRVALLVMGDGSARRTRTSPGPYDPAAISYDETIEAALADGDTAALRALDQPTADRLWVSGRAAWQVLAGAADERTAARNTELLLSAAPYGVGYFVAVWTGAGVDDF